MVIAVQSVSVVPSIVKVASALLMAHILTSKPPAGRLVQELVIDAAILLAQAMSVYFTGKTLRNRDFTHIVSVGVIVNRRYGYDRGELVIFPIMVVSVPFPVYATVDIVLYTRCRANGQPAFTVTAGIAMS
jgi:uncharacterized membrane protein